MSEGMTLGTCFLRLFNNNLCINDMELFPDRVKRLILQTDVVPGEHTSKLMHTPMKLTVFLSVLFD